jgi:hypothetical protein
VADDAARTRVAERLEALQSTNQRLGRALEAVADGASRIPGSAIEREPVDGLTNAIAAFHEPLPPRLKALSAAAERAAQRVPPLSRGRPSGLGPQGVRSH